VSIVTNDVKYPHKEIFAVMEFENPQGHESPELEIERERRKRAEFEFKTERSKREAAQKAEETKQERFGENLRRELASTGYTFHVDDGELKTLIEQTSKAKFLVRETGQFVVERDGTQISLKDVIEGFALTHPSLLQDRSQIAHLVKPEHELSREDFPDVASKARAIAEKGIDWWESLPAKRVAKIPADLETLTKETYLALSDRHKASLGLTERQIGFLLYHGTLKNFKK